MAKLEAAGSGGAVQVLRTESDAPVVGPDAPTANSKLVKLDIATPDWSLPTSGLRVMRPEQANQTPQSATATLRPCDTRKRIYGGPVPLAVTASRGTARSTTDDEVRASKNQHQHPALANFERNQPEVERGCGRSSRGHILAGKPVACRQMDILISSRNGRQRMGVTG